MCDCKRPRHRAAPVVRHQNEFLAVPVVVRELANVFDQNIHAVIFHSGGFIGKIVTAHIGSDGQMVFPEFRELVLPLVPEFRESVQE